MSSITTINSGDLITSSRSTINTNFANLNADKIETSTLDTDTTLAANSDAKLATQKATKAYVDSRTTGRAFALGAATYDIASASGTQNIAHGLGVVPALVKISAFYSNLALNNAFELSSFAYTVYNGTTQVSGHTSQNAASSATANHSTHGATFRVYGFINPAGYQEGVVTVTSTNISIAWTKTGTPTGTINLVWEASV